MINIEGYKKVKEKLKDNTLVVVSKKRTIEQIKEYYDLGVRDFGENKAQELLTKVDLANDIRWHFIGHLQTNKVKQILPYVSLIHSVESYDLVKEIDKQAKKLNKVQEILVQFNVAKEETKTGLDIKDAYEFIKECQNYPNVLVKGIMAMGPHTEDKNEIRRVFKETYTLYNSLKEEFKTIDTLSMGMSDDFEIALDEGSNMIRVGSLLF